MADFCKQCLKFLFDIDTGDLAGLSTAKDTKKGLYASALCESCGVTLVDHEGTCVYIGCPIHGKNNKKIKNVKASKIVT